MRDRVRHEIVDLHRFFEAWMDGTVENVDPMFARVGGVLAPGFVLVSPDGRVTPRDELVASLRSAHAVHRGVDPPFRIWIENFRFQEVGAGHGLALYEEWQEKDGETRGRVSSALFEADDTAPHGVRWLHVHETWLPAT